jgi:GR25 family glycosyltransferase involved in LPS biosynthesis
MIQKYFGKIFCINLDRRPDRWEHFIKQSKEFNLTEFERVSAVDGKNIDLSKYPTNLTDGELGLVLTTIKIFEGCLENKYNNVLILEDDCVFEKEILNVDKYFQNLPPNWDMIYFGGNHNIHGNYPEPVKVNDFVKKVSYTYSSHMIGFNIKMYEQILSLLKTYQFQVDIVYSMLQKENNCYTFYPRLSTQLVDYSDIQNKVTDYNWLIK